MTAASGDSAEAGIEAPFWRAVAVFRVASLVYAAVLLVRAGGYQRPAAGWAVLGVMAAWTLVTLYAYSRPRMRGKRLLAADMLVTVGCLLASPYVQGPYQPGALPVTATWMGGPVLAWSIRGGGYAGAAAAAVMAALDLWLRGVRDLGAFGVTSVSINGAVLLFLAGILVGQVARLAQESGARMQRAVEIEAAGRERERLARGIHDSVLQVLALVQRRGQEIGGEAAELGRLAGEQETALRELVSIQREPAVAGSTDLRELLLGHGNAETTVATPATPLRLPTHIAHETAAAVAAALDNVRRHCGPAHAWILAEEGDGTVVVTVRDDGPGMPEGRIEEAAAAGRLGIAQSIRGRIADLGGSVLITSTPGQGTEVELTIPT